MAKKFDFEISRKYVALYEDTKVSYAIKHIRRITRRGMIFYVYVIDREGTLRGVLHLRNLLVSQGRKRVRDLMLRKLTVVNSTMTEDQIFEIFIRSRFLSLPVVEENGKLLGTVTLKDAMARMREEDIEDILRIKGADIKVFDRSIIQRIRVKAPWLITTILGGFIAGSIIYMFEPTLKKVLALSFFIPLITAMGESVGGQSSAIVIEGIILGKITGKKFRLLFLRQMLESFLMGLGLGAAVGFGAYLWVNNPSVGLILGLTVFLAIMIATLFGTLIPVFLKKINVDPIVSTNPLVFAVTDIIVLVVYFSSAIFFVKNYI
jgi:magnesium transporter